MAISTIRNLPLLFSFWDGFIYKNLLLLSSRDELEQQQKRDRKFVIFCVTDSVCIFVLLCFVGKNIGQENREFLEGPGPSHVCDKLLLYDTGRGTSVETESGGSSEPQVKDSGIDTGLSSSSQTLYEEIAKQKVFVAHFKLKPVKVLYLNK